MQPVGNRFKSAHPRTEAFKGRLDPPREKRPALRELKNHYKEEVENERVILGSDLNKLMQESKAALDSLVAKLPRGSRPSAGRAGAERGPSGITRADFCQLSGRL